MSVTQAGRFEANKEEKMDVFTAIGQRSSVRAYKTTDVEEDKLKKILEAARLSPSASNRQEWKFIVIIYNVLNNAA